MKRAIFFCLLSGDLISMESTIDSNYEHAANSLQDSARELNAQSEQGATGDGKSLHFGTASKLRHERLRPVSMDESSESFDVSGYKNTHVFTTQRHLAVQREESDSFSESIEWHDDHKKEETDSHSSRVIKTGLISTAIGVPVGAALFFVGRKALGWVQSKSQEKASKNTELANSLLVEDISPWFERFKKWGNKLYLDSALDVLCIIARKDPFLLLNDEKFMQKMDGAEKVEFFGILDEYAANYFCAKLLIILREDQADLLQVLLEAPDQLLTEKNMIMFTEEQKKELEELSIKMHFYREIYSKAIV